MHRTGIRSWIWIPATSTGIATVIRRRTGVASLPASVASIPTGITTRIGAISSITFASAGIPGSIIAGMLVHIITSIITRIATSITSTIRIEKTHIIYLLSISLYAI